MNGAAVQNMSQGLFLLLSRSEKPELRTEREGSTRIDKKLGKG